MRQAPWVKSSVDKVAVAVGDGTVGVAAIATGEAVGGIGVAVDEDVVVWIRVGLGKEVAGIGVGVMVVV